MFSVLPYSTFTVQILYKLYSLQLNCTYSNYTEAAATYSACYRTAHLLYKYCTVCNLTVLTVITQKLLHVQLQNSTEAVSWCFLKCSAVRCLTLYVTTSRDQILPRNCDDWIRTATTSQRYTTHGWVTVRRLQGGWFSLLFVFNWMA